MTDLDRLSDSIHTVSPRYIYIVRQTVVHSQVNMTDLHRLSDNIHTAVSPRYISSTIIFQDLPKILLLWWKLQDLNN